MKNYEPVKPGTYAARPIAWERTMINDKPVVKVTFRFKEGGYDRELRWNGYFTEKARKFTLQALIRCGFRDADFTRFDQGVPGKALDTETLVDVKVEQSTSNGKTYSNITAVGSAKAEIVPSAFGDIAGDMIALKQEMGVTDEMPQADPFKEDLPF